MEEIVFSAKERAELLRAIEDGRIPSSEPPKNLPGSYMGERVKAASIVWEYLHQEQRETPPEVIAAFDEICERLNIPYVFICRDSQAGLAP